MGKRDEGWLVICNASLCNPNYGVRVIQLKTVEDVQSAYTLLDQELSKEN